MEGSDFCHNLFRKGVSVLNELKTLALAEEIYLY